MHMLLADVICLALGYIFFLFLFLLPHSLEIHTPFPPPQFDSIHARQTASPIIHQPTTPYDHTTLPSQPAKNLPIPSNSITHPIPLLISPPPPHHPSSSSSSPLLLPTTTTNSSSSSSASFSTNTRLNNPSKRSLSSCNFAILVAKKCNFASRSRTWRSLRSRKAR